MFSKLAIVSSLAILAVATPTPGGGSTPPASQCNTAPVQCCNSVQKAGAPGVATLLGLLGIVLQDVNIPIGVTCSPIDVVGVGSGASCNNQAVCCENNSFS
ncbi:fungal hydrophobin, partial [Rickenella mellea]